MLADEEMKDVIFIDFEYMPGPNISFAAQKLYDHLAFINMAWAFLPPRPIDALFDTKDGENWLSIFTSLLDEDMKNTDLSMFSPKINHLLADKDISILLQRILS